MVRSNSRKSSTWTLQSPLCGPQGGRSCSEAGMKVFPDYWINFTAESRAVLLIFKKTRLANIYYYSHNLAARSPRE